VFIERHRTGGAPYNRRKQEDQLPGPSFTLIKMAAPLICTAEFSVDG